MHRNPLDTAISYYFQLHKTEFCLNQNGVLRYLKNWFRFLISNRLPPKDINKFVLHKAYGVENICKFNQAYIQLLQGNPNNLIITYEMASQNPIKIIRKLNKFIGDKKDINLQDILRKISFDNMRSLEKNPMEVNKLKKFAIILHKTKVVSDPDALKVRKGIVKNYKKYLDDKTIEKAKKIASSYGFNNI